MSEYFFLLDKLEKVKKLSRPVWLAQCYIALELIRKEEDYLFFKMNEPVKDELEYYVNHEKELSEIIEILDEKYEVCSYHNIIEVIISTGKAIAEGMDLEYLMIDEVIEGERMVAFYGFPEGSLEALTKSKKDIVEEEKKKSEVLYI